MLKEAGYATALAGKWQLIGKVPTLVKETGFDEYLMWAYKNNLPPGVEHTGGWEGPAGGKTSRYWHPSLLRNGQYVPTNPDSYGPDMFTECVIDFATRHQDRPFFIYYPMALTHAPYYSTPATHPNETEKFRHAKDKFRENVEYMDTLVGRSFALLLRGEPYVAREWIYSYLGGRRLLRTERWLLEDNAPNHYGRLYDCGTRRDGQGYREVTQDPAPEVQEIKRQFAAILADKPVPEVAPTKAARQGKAKAKAKTKGNRKNRGENQVPAQPNSPGGNDDREASYSD